MNPHPQCYVPLDEPDGTKFRPSNGTEGELFMEGWCYHCKKDLAHQKSNGTEDGCPIIPATMVYSEDDEEYPKEWVWQGGKPVCTAFENADD